MMENKHLKATEMSSQSMGNIKGSIENQTTCPICPVCGGKEWIVESTTGSILRMRCANCNKIVVIEK